MQLRNGHVYRLLHDGTRFVAREGPQGGTDLFTTQEMTWHIRQASYRVQPTTGAITYHGAPTAWHSSDLIDTGTTIAT